MGIGFPGMVLNARVPSLKSFKVWGTKFRRQSLYPLNFDANNHLKLSLSSRPPIMEFDSKINPATNHKHMISHWMRMEIIIVVVDYCGWNNQDNNHILFVFFGAQIGNSIAEGAHNTTNLAEPAQLEWISRYIAYVWHVLECKCPL